MLPKINGSNINFIFINAFLSLENILVSEINNSFGNVGDSEEFIVIFRCPVYTAKWTGTRTE